MRIISGRARGIPLLTPGYDIRPTAGRVREAVFSKLGEIVPRSRVADLFAGSGAYGIEALSREASSAVFVEKNRAACDIIRRNIEKARLADAADIHPRDVYTWLRTARHRFDLVFADPPFKKSSEDFDHTTALLNSRELAALLASDGIFILESLASREKLEVPPTWKLLDQRSYGSSLVSFLQPRPNDLPERD
ncbi:MAG: 16S rRNA (guanine(966)-N(2))-methyltransferase RsmD [Verrucomicrobiales bacterium]